MAAINGILASSVLLPLSVHPLAPAPTPAERAGRAGQTHVAGTVVVSESTTPLHGLGVVTTFAQIDLGGQIQFEVYLGDRLVEAIAADFRSGEIVYDEYTDFDGLSGPQVIRIVGAFVHATAHMFDDFTYGGTEPQAINWCKIGCTAAGGAAATGVGGGVFAACMYVFKNKKFCAGVTGAIFAATKEAVQQACEERFCED